MDPISAIGFASSVVQLITFTSDLLSKAGEIHSSTDGALIENLELEAITESLQVLNQDVTSGARSLTRADKQLKELCDGCQKVTKDLLQIIRSLKGSSSHVRWNSFRQAVLTVRKEKEVQALCNRLERYRRQIDTTLLFTLRESIQRVGPPVMQPAEGTSWQKTIIDELQRNDWKEKNKQDMAMFSACFTESTGYHRQQLNQLRILQNLRFSDIADRYERIEEAHKKTFEWIFSDTEYQGERPSHPVVPSGQKWSDRHVSFVDWLRSDTNLFWITGKPGAGKSTLMKYLYNDTRTRPLLDSWKGEDELVTASFFFWNSGTVMQMSKEGLLRAILYEALQTCPKDVPHHFPDRWEYYQLFGADTRPWSWLELTKAFESLIDSKSKKFFFVIDGLDEFQGDCAELATWIVKVSSRPNVKICVASRPWLDFEDAFKSIPFLRVEDLSAPDIYTFTTEKLQASEMFCELQTLEPNSAQILIAEVLEKASGVFLWVRLVVMSLLEGLRDGDTMADLLERLRDLPSDLENLFQKIFDGLTSKHRQQASRLIRIILASERPFTLLSLSFAHNTIDEAITAEVGHLDSQAANFRTENARRYLSSRCKGLLEAPDFAQQGPHTTIQFLHKTVRDFVCRPSIQIYFKEIEETFDPHRSICAAQIFTLKSPYSTRVADATGGLFESVFTQAAKSSEMMTSADDAFKAKVVIELERLWHEISKSLPGKGMLGRGTLGITGTDFLTWAIDSGLFSYVRHTASHHDLNSSHTGVTPLRAVVRRMRRDNEESSVAMIKILLESGADPNMYSGKFASPWVMMMKELEFGYPDNVRWGFNVSTHHVVAIKHKRVVSERAIALMKRKRVVFELFSEHGAVPPLRLKGCSEEQVVLKLYSRWLDAYEAVDHVSGRALTRLVSCMTGKPSSRPTSHAT